MDGLKIYPSKVEGGVFWNVELFLSGQRVAVTEVQDAALSEFLKHRIAYLKALALGEKVNSPVGG